MADEDESVMRRTYVFTPESDGETGTVEQGESVMRRKLPN